MVRFMVFPGADGSSVTIADLKTGATEKVKVGKPPKPAFPPSPTPMFVHAHKPVSAHMVCAQTA